jgi:hypothetical protein
MLTRRASEGYFKLQASVAGGVPGREIRAQRLDFVCKLLYMDSSKVGMLVCMPVVKGSPVISADPGFSMVFDLQFGLQVGLQIGLHGV